MVENMSEHKVKSWTYLFEAAVAGIKTHDIRILDERDYKVGDTLVLQEFDQTEGAYTGREQAFKITYITSRNTPCAMSCACLNRDFCILSISKID
jgi:hypothetical protein